MVRCTNLPQFLAADGQRVLVKGVYHALAVYQGTQEPDIEEDHAAITLGDGKELLLEPNWSEAAQRDPAERSRFHNQEVEVEGIARAKAPKPPEPIAYVTGPCISAVLSIRQVGSK